jgi:copper transport protein
MRYASTHGRIVSVLAALLLALMAVQPASAHAQLLTTEPSANAVIESSPETLRLIFNEPVTALAMVMVAPDGERTDLTASTMSGETVAVMVPDALGEGTHVLSWRVVSTDGHPIGGALVFSVGSTSQTAIGDVPASDRLVSLVLWSVKAMLFAGMFFGLGGAVFALAAPLPVAAQTFSLAFAIVGVLAAPLSLGLHGLDALGLPITSLLDIVAWRAGAATSSGATVLAVVLAQLLAIIAFAGTNAGRLAWAAWGVPAVALALSGHASSAHPQWLTRPAVALHVAGLLFWIGALVPLALLLRERSPAADDALAKFSAFAPFAVAGILVSGIALGVVQMGLPGAHWLSPYAAILAAKLALVAVLLALALWNRLKLTGPTLAGAVTPRYRLRQSIAGEIAIVLLILALVAGWRFTPPPRALADVAAAAEVSALPLYAHAMSEQAMADLTISPGRAGPVAIELVLADGTGAPAQPQSVLVTLSSPDQGIEPLRFEAAAEDGVWRVDAATIPLAGNWLIEIDIRMSRFSLVRLATEIDIP